MGTEIEPYDLYIPSPGEPGVTWGLQVAANFTKINDALQANATAVETEATDRAEAVTEVTEALEAEIENRISGESATLATATGRAAALAIVFGT